MKVFSLIHPPIRIFTYFVLSSFAASSSFACDQDDIRYSDSSNRIYIEEAVTCSLSDLTLVTPRSALELLDSDTATWMLRATIIIKNGGKLDLHGIDQGGDVNELRLLSNPGSGNFIYIQPNYGTLDVNGVLITSWDEQDGSPDTDLSDGRAHLKGRSFLDNEGVARESTINIDNSELAYLGYNFAESYGLAFKVKAKRHEEHIFDQVDIFGKVTNSYIHDNYMGFYSWGAYGVEISNNTVANNISYGIDPHDNSDYLTITDNLVYDNGRHGIICSQHCDHLTISGNTVMRNLHGIMLHRNITDSLVENNILKNNRGGGIVLFESSNNVVRNNEVFGNKNGIRLSLGSHDNRVEGNVVYGNRSHGIYFYKGSDEPETTDGVNRNNLFLSNEIEDSADGFKISDSDSNDFIANTFSGGAPFYIYRGINNYFSENQYEGSFNINTRGESGDYANTFLELDGNAQININSEAEFLLSNENGRVLAPEQPDVLIPISPLGTRLLLNEDNIGSKSDVLGLPFWVVPSSADVVIKNPRWLTGKSWTIKAQTDAAQVAFTVGGLTPNLEHSIRKNGALLQTVSSNTEGVLSFTDTLASAANFYGYSVTDGAGGGVVTPFSPTEDTYAQGGSNANTVYGASKTIQVKNKGVGNYYTREGFLSFDLNGFSAPSSVILRLTMKASKAEQVSVVLSSVADTTWGESSLTYANKPEARSVLTSITMSNTSNQTKDFDVTAYVRAEHQAGRNKVSFTLTGASTSPNAIIKIVSKDGGNGKPVLIVTH